METKVWMGKPTNTHTTFLKVKPILYELTEQKQSATKTDG
jgi:hypothetical protein